MKTLSNCSENGIQERPITSSSVGSTPTAATIFGDKNRAKTMPIRDELGGILRPRILSVGVPIINGPARSAGNPWFSIKNEAASDTAEILIYDFIGKDYWSEEGVGAKDFSEALSKIPKDKKILVKINSPGGNVRDGITIYTELKNRGDKVTTYITGAAISIASVIALAGKKVLMARTAQFMIHEPWSGMYVEGTKKVILDAAQKMGNALDSAQESILRAYMDKTGMPKEDLCALMEAETWMSGDKALECKFVDTVTDDAPITNSFEISNFKRVPEEFRKMQNSAQNGGPSQIMKRSQIIARLKKMGKTVDDNATDEQLVAQLEAAIEALATASTPPLAAPAVPGASAPDAATTNRIAQLEARCETERRTRITSAVATCVGERRIPAAQQEAWITDCMRDETILARIQAMPQVLDDNTGLRVECVSEAADDISKHIVNLGAGINRMARGEIDDRDLATTIMAKSRFVVKHLDRLVKIMNEGSNTIDSHLKIDVLLQQAIVQFKKVIRPLLGFNKNIGAIPLRGTTSIQVPYIANDTTTSTTWNAANGYVAGDTAVDYRTLTLTRYYKAIRFTADELRRQPYLMLNETFMKAVDQLIYDVWLGFLAVITAANYNATVGTVATAGIPAGWPKAAGGFDSNAIIDLRNLANQAQWPITGRTLVVNSDYDTALMKDSAVKNALAYGSAMVIQDGQLQRILGWDYGMSPNQPTNAESLVGFIAQENAVLVGSSPIAPTEEELRAGLEYQVASDPELGISLEYKNFGQPQMNRAFRVVEANWAAGKGNEKNLFRLTSG